MADRIKIRALGPEDYPVLQNVQEGTFDFPLIPEQTIAFLASAAHRIVVAQDGARVIGLATGVVMLHPDKEPSLFVNEVGVHDDYRRRGIGRRLVEKLFDLCRAEGVTGAWLATEDDNVAARALYRSMGARETGGIVVYDWGGAMDD